MTDPYKIAQQQAYNQFPAGYNPMTGTVVQPTVPPPSMASLGWNPAKDSAAPGSSSLADGFTKFPGAWWNKIPQVSFTQVLDNPDQFARMWSQAHGYGQQTERALQNFAPLPVNFLYAMGKGDEFGTGKSFGPQKQADAQGRLYNQLLTGGGGGGRYLDPRQIMRSVVGATIQTDSKGSYIGPQDPIAMQVADPSLSPQQQADNFMKFVTSTVGSILPRTAFESYMNILQREKGLFQDFAAKNPTVSMTFNRWIGQRLGENGGL